MHRLPLIVLSALMAVSFTSVDAFARNGGPQDGWHGDDNNDRGRYREKDRDNRGNRNDNQKYRQNYDNHRHDSRRDDWRWHDRHYSYRPHSWVNVTTYNQPGYIYEGRYSETYSEIRCTDSYNPFGTLLGAGIGGLAGSAVGKGSGRAVAIGTGAVLGGLIGTNVTRQRCTERVFNDVPLGRPVSWQAGPQEAYAVVPVRDYREEGRYCREYQSYATVGGKRSETYGTACLQPDGAWEIVN